MAHARLPSAFLPNEDQGFLIVDIQAPPEASAARTLEVIRQAESTFRAEPAVENILTIAGFSFSGAGQNAGLAFVTLKGWSERGVNDSAQAIAARVNGQLARIRDAITFALSPPPISGLGASSGFTFRLQDRGGATQAALAATRDRFMEEASQSQGYRDCASRACRTPLRSIS